MKRAFASTILLALGLACSLLAPARAINVTITNIGTLGGSDTYAYAVNKSQQVVGYSITSSGAYHAFRWQGGKMYDLGHLGGNYSIATCINDYTSFRGGPSQVAGYSRTASGRDHAFRWDTYTGMQDIGTLPGGKSSWATGITYYGKVVGNADTASGNIHAFHYDAVTKKMRDLGTLGGKYSYATGVNDNDTVVGISETASGEQQGFIWTPSGGMQSILAFIPSTIYNDNVLTGTIYGTGVVHKYLSSSYNYIGNLPNGTGSGANKANGLNYAVGYATTSTWEQRAVRWSPTTGLQDFNALVPTSYGWVFNQAAGLLNSYMTLLNGTYKGQRRACIATIY